MKAKLPEFEETAKDPKKSKGEELSFEGQRLSGEFRNYLTRNRVLSAFSKEGEIEHESQIGNYIKLVLEDAKEEFLEDHKDDFSQLPDKEKSKVLKQGSVIVPFLKEFL